MKKNVTIIVCLLLLFSSVLPAQNDLHLLRDPLVRSGKLDNGLTYYIRHNAYPEKRADFYIAQNVGSILEEDSQLGLAHFLEHMAFNGTKNFPGRKNMLDYLEKNGAKFGENINAYTSYDETVYNLSNIPVIRETLIDSCLLILHDWSSFITLENAEIDKERNIINEEWRTRNGASTRTMDLLFKFAFAGTKYADRMPIGKMDVVMNFSHQTLKDYYHKWYRPDLQAIIVVGDIDVDKIESTIQTMFSDIKKPIDPAKREYIEIKDYDEPKIITITDPENISTNVSVYYPHPAQDKQTKQSESGYKTSLIRRLVSNMLSFRLAEIAQKQDSPFLGAHANNGDFLIVPTKEAWTLEANCKKGEIENALDALLTENERAIKYGFTNSELEREKAAFISTLENAYNNREKQLNSSYVREYVSNFTTGEPVFGIENEYKLAKKILSTINIEIVNECIREISANKNALIVVTGPQKEGLIYPNNAQLLTIFQNTSQKQLTPYNEKTLPSDLIEEMPASGKIIKETYNKDFGSTEWILDNGIHVVLKKTDYKDDQILFSSVGYGGTSLFSDDEALNAKLIRNVIPLGGFGQFSNIELSKILSSKSINVGISISNTTQGLTGSSSVKDLKTMMQLAYLTMTQPGKDKEAYNSFINRLRNQLENVSSSPSTVFSDSLMTSIYGNNPRIQRIHLEDIDRLDYDRIIGMYKELFAYPSTQTFTFIGSIDEATLKPLVEKYLGALPKTSHKAEYKNNNSNMRKGTFSKIFTQYMENPKATSTTFYWANLKRNLKNSITINVLNQILDLVYTRTIREAEGGTYGVTTRASIEKAPNDGRTSLQIAFDTNPEKEAHLRALAQTELLNIANKGPEYNDFKKTMEYMEKSLNESTKTNAYWLGILSTFYLSREDYHSTYLRTLHEIKPEDVQTLLQNLLKQQNKIEVVMLPKTMDQ